MYCWSVDCLSKKFAFGIDSVKVALVVAEVEVEDYLRKEWFLYRGRGFGQQWSVLVNSELSETRSEDRQGSCVEDSVTTALCLMILCLSHSLCLVCLVTDIYDDDTRLSASRMNRGLVTRMLPIYEISTSKCSSASSRVTYQVA